MKRSLPECAEPRHLDKLACVSRLMFDQRVLDLRKENEELLSQLAWHEYSVKELRERLALANQENLGGFCHCCDCFESKRFDTACGFFKYYPKKWEDEECIIKKRLIFHAERLGFDVVKMNHLYHSDLPKTSHIIIWNDTETALWNMQYGPKLDQKDFHKNSMLGKLKELFQILDDENFFNNPETGEDYVSSSL